MKTDFEINIEKDVPIVKMGHYNKNDTLLHAMQEMISGDSFIFPASKRSLLQARINKIGKSNPEWQFITRRVEDGKIRVYRIA